MSGLWGPITGKFQSATIDWCETNYDVTDYIAEFWNSVSSLALCFIGILDYFILKRSPAGKDPYEYMICYLCNVVGIGSFMFHGTLKYSFQLWDEIPMIFVISVAVYGYIALHPSSRKYRSQVFWGFLIYDAIWVVLHACFGFVVGFQVNFFGLKLTMLGFMVHSKQIYYQNTIGNRTSKIFLELYMAFLLLAASCWMIDQQFCSHVNQLPANPQLHAWWHVFIAFTAHYSLMFAIILARTNMDVYHCKVEGCIVREPRFLYKI